jgi:hypothetical protein
MHAFPTRLGKNTEFVSAKKKEMHAGSLRANIHLHIRQRGNLNQVIPAKAGIC